MRTPLTILMINLLAGMILWGGCGKPEPLKVGKIDTSKLIQQFPQFRTTSEQMAKLQQELAALHIDPDRPPTEREKKKVEAALKKREELKMQFFKDTLALLKDTTYEVAQKERFDLIIMDAPSVGGTDITDLILYKLKSMPENKK